jgi:hypothetical protein
VHDAVKACTEMNHFKIFMQKLYTLYSMSPKNRRALEQSAASLGVELLKIGKVLDVRWVASSFRTVRAVWVSYAALYKHFSSAADDTSLDSKDRAQFKGLAAKLSSSTFLLNLALMYDALEELSELSESLQADSISVYKGHRLITRQIEIFSSRKCNGGERYDLAKQAVADGTFNEVPISQSKRICDKEINPQQFYQALVDSMSSRLMPESERHIIQCVDVLIPSVWPAFTSPEYGEVELKKACEIFLFEYSTTLKQQYRDFKDQKGIAADGLKLKQLICCIQTLPVSTAACERGFSRMNIICTPLRSSLTVKHMSSLMFISAVGPPLDQWNPTAYVKSWLALGRHAATDPGNAKVKKTTELTHANSSVWKCF